MNDINAPELTWWMAAAITFVALMIAVPIALRIVKLLGLYAIVEEGSAHVYVLFGNVVGTLRAPGFYFLPAHIGLAALIVNWLGRRYVIDMRLGQRYLRTQPVNSEEGAPMGIGIWYEMSVGDPLSYLFKNADPEGSLAANVSNAAVRCLSNMPLAEMLQTRHAMSAAVRQDVSPKSVEWGYKLGSVYIRKVHFRDGGMIQQIEAKVVNRLRQVTAAIKQHGANQVSIITSAAERQAAVEFAKAQAIRPKLVGSVLRIIAEDTDISEALFDVLEVQRVSQGNAALTLVPSGANLQCQIGQAPPARPPLQGR